MRVLGYLQLYKETGEEKTSIYTPTHSHTHRLWGERAKLSLTRTRARIPAYLHTYVALPLPPAPCAAHGKSSLLREDEKERKVDRRGQRAEIKGRRGDEFVKKAEAGQQHASRTSKGQDEMKSNRRCPSPPLSSRLSPPPPPPPSPPLSFIHPPFLASTSCLRHFFSLPSSSSLSLPFSSLYFSSSPFLLLLLGHSTRFRPCLLHPSSFVHPRVRREAAQRERGGGGGGRTQTLFFTRRRGDESSHHTHTVSSFAAISGRIVAPPPSRC